MQSIHLYQKCIQSLSSCAFFVVIYTSPQLFHSFPIYYTINWHPKEINHAFLRIPVCHCHSEIFFRVVLKYMYVYTAEWHTATKHFHGRMEENNFMCMCVVASEGRKKGQESDNLYWKSYNKRNKINWMKNTYKKSANNFVWRAMNKPTHTHKKRRNKSKVHTAQRVGGETENEEKHSTDSYCNKYTQTGNNEKNIIRRTHDDGFFFSLR